MKLLRSTFTTSPFCASFTYKAHNGEIKQQAIHQYDLDKILNDETDLTEEKLLKMLRFNPEKFFDNYAEKFIDVEQIKSDVESKTEEIDFDGVSNTLKQFLIKLYKKNKEDEGLIAWIKFAKKLKENVDPYIQEQLFSWLKYLIDEESIAITKEGNILGYKGITAEGYSVHTGSAYVDNVLHEGQIPNKVGSIISMERDKVEANPLSSCSYGLHAGSWKYATSFAPNLILVEIDPADVVSIPVDANSQKLRCSKYKVVKQLEKQEVLHGLIYDF